MQSVESVLKAEILRAIRAAGSLIAGDEAGSIIKRYGTVIRRAHLFGYDVSAITFGEAHQPTNVWLKHIPIGPDR